MFKGELTLDVIIKTPPPCDVGSFGVTTLVTAYIPGQMSRIGGICSAYRLLL
jgi:hypothetical protein